MNSTASLHVVPSTDGGWDVRREGDDQPLSEHGNETEAERAATRRARAAGGTEVIVHDRYWRLHPADMR